MLARTRHESYGQCPPSCCQETVRHYSALRSSIACRRRSRPQAVSSCRPPDVRGSRCVDQHKPVAKCNVNMVKNSRQNHAVFLVESKHTNAVSIYSKLTEEKKQNRM